MEVLGCLKERATMGPRPRIAEEDVRTEARLRVPVFMALLDVVILREPLCTILAMEKLSSTKTDRLPPKIAI